MECYFNSSSIVILLCIKNTIIRVLQTTFITNYRGFVHNFIGFNFFFVKA